MHQGNDLQKICNPSKAQSLPQINGRAPAKRLKKAVKNL
jgi:hypothetical protein